MKLTFTSDERKWLAHNFAGLVAMESKLPERDEARLDLYRVLASKFQGEAPYTPLSRNELKAVQVLCTLMSETVGKIIEEYTRRGVGFEEYKKKAEEKLMMIFGIQGKAEKKL